MATSPTRPTRPWSPPSFSTSSPRERRQLHRRHHHKARATRRATNPAARGAHPTWAAGRLRPLDTVSDKDLSARSEGLEPPTFIRRLVRAVQPGPAEALAQ